MDGDSVSFGRPEFVWVGVAVALLAGLGLAAITRRRARLARFLGGRAAARRLSSKNLYRYPWVRLVLLAVAGLALGSAAGDPKWPTAVEEPPPPPDHQLMIAIDVSASMQAVDAGRTRLAAAVEAARSVALADHGRGTGLILFAGVPYLLSPPTEDRAVLEYLLSGIAPTVASAYDPGTRLTVALDAARAAFQDATTLDDEAFAAPASNLTRTIVLITDGDSNETEAEIATSVESLRDAGVTVHFASVGSGRGGSMIMPRGQYQIGGQVMTPGGAPAISRPRPELLANAAAMGEGSHVEFNVDDPEALVAAIFGSSTGEWTRTGSEAVRALESAVSGDRASGSAPDSGPETAARALSARVATVVRMVTGLDPVGRLVTVALAALLIESLLDVRRPRLGRIPRRRAA